MAGAGRLLPVGGMLMVYGPFKSGGVARPESNAKFDETLRGQNAEWGLRDVEAVQALAEQVRGELGSQTFGGACQLSDAKTRCTLYDGMLYSSAITDPLYPSVQAGFVTVETVDMPANNTMLVFRRQ